MNQHFNTMCREAPLCGLIQINMEQKTIPLNKGIVRNTSLATDGELIDCVNLMPKNGQMMNAPTLAETEETLKDNETLLYIHPTSVGDKYIITDGTNIKVKDSDTLVYALTDEETLYEVKHIGNVLVVLTSKRTAMFLYEDGGYSDYTFDFDNIDIQFGLSGEVLQQTKTDDISIVKGDSIERWDDESLLNGNFEEVTEETFNVKIQQGYTYKFQVSKFDATSNKFWYNLYFIDSEGNSVMVGEKRVNGSEYRYTAESDFIKVKINIIRFDYNDDTFKASKASGNLVIWQSAVTTNVWRVNTDNFNAVLGAVNKFISEMSVEKNRFMFPFFVRYAIELLDGSHIKPSAPCLLVPSDGIVPYLNIMDKDLGTNNEMKVEYCTSAFVADIKFKIISDISVLTDREKIIKGISIAVSSPIYRYNSGATNDDLNKALEVRPISEVRYNRTYAEAYKENEYAAYNLELLNESVGLSPNYYVSLPQHDDITKQIEGLSAFRIVRKIPLSELQELVNSGTNKMDGFKTLELEEGALKGLEGRAVLEDNTSSLCHTRGKIAHTYNSRLNIANCTKDIFKGYKPSLMNGWINAELPTYPPMHNGSESITEYGDTKHDYGVVTSMTIDNVGVKATQKEQTDGSAKVLWMYYPRSKANGMVIHKRRNNSSDGSKYGYSQAIGLTEHPLWDGAYWFNGFTQLNFNNAGDVADYVSGAGEAGQMEYPQLVATSEVNNPFVMKQTTSLNDEVKALATTTKAISEGQFGQFPLYAFCNDGIWALEPSSDGTYASKQPVSRDVCSNPKAITQTDNAVVFPTLQGLKVLQGGTTANISNVMDGKAEDISFLEDVIAEYNDLCLTDNTDFNEAIQDARIVYDYVNNLLHIYTEKASYIYNLSSGDWTRTDDEKPRAIVPGYPYSTVQVDTKLYRYEKPSADGTRNGMLLTRETAFDDPLTMKIIKDLRVMRKHGNAKVAVWVSNDRQKWGRLTSLRMHSYKWYRFAIFTELNNTDALEGIVARIESRKTNKMR